jgi:CheY-like chemotaxis protein
LLNLLGNAVKYTRVGGIELRVMAGTTSGGLRIEVADSGPGIHEASLDRVFQDFERLASVGSVEGAGMGLAIAARLIRLMDGTIGYIANPGGGTVFWLELPPGAVPAVPSLEGLAQAFAKLATADPQLTRKRILLVDDIAMNRDVIGSFLCAAGHVAVLAKSGPEALRLASEQTFDLILMDMRMPEMDGLEATRHIRALPAPHNAVPILALTAYTFPEQIAQARDAGMDGHIAKPVDYAALMGTITATITGTKPRWWKHGSGPPPNEANGERQPRPRFDRAQFDQTLAFLAPNEVAANLQQLRERNEQMLQMLDHPTAPALLVDAAHGLASAVGMFGFVALSVAARTYEHALANDEPEAERLAAQVQSEARAGIETLDALLCETWTRST